MSLGSLPVVEFHAMPAMVESPTNDTGGASTGGVAAIAISGEVVSGTVAATTIVAAEMPSNHRLGCGRNTVAQVPIKLPIELSTATKVSAGQVSRPNPTQLRLSEHQPNMMGDTVVGERDRACFGECLSVELD